MVVNAVYFALLPGNLLLIITSLILGPRLLRACRAAAFVNVLGLMTMVVPLGHLVVNSHPPPEAYSAIRILLICTAPVLIEFFALLAILRWRMQQP